MPAPEIVSFPAPPKAWKTAASLLSTIALPSVTEAPAAAVMLTLSIWLTLAKLAAVSVIAACTSSVSMAAPEPPRTVSVPTSRPAAPIRKESARAFAPTR